MSVSCADTHFTHQAYLLVQMGINASNDARHSEAADHFTAAISTGALSFKLEIDSKYEVFVVVCSYDSTENAFDAQLRAALWVGPQVIVANWKPESVQCTPSGG
jgi:hypothetical protein